MHKKTASGSDPQHHKHTPQPLSQKEPSRDDLRFKMLLGSPVQIDFPPPLSL